MFECGHLATMRQTHRLKGSQIPFDECAVGSNDGWGAEINQIAGLPSGCAVKGRREWVFFAFYQMAVRPSELQ